MGDRLTVLVVDDDVLIAMTCAEMVSDLGYRAIEAYSGAEALELIAKEPRIDLLITDFTMPGMNGVQLAKAAWEAAPNLKIIVASGYSDLPDDADRDIPLIPKPYSPEDLAAGISKAFAAVVT